MTTTTPPSLQNPYEHQQIFLSTSLNLDDVSALLSHKHDSDDEVSAASSISYQDFLQWSFCEHCFMLLQQFCARSQPQL